MDNSPNSGQLVLDQLRSSLDGSRYSLSAVFAAIVVAFGGAAVILLGVLLGWHSLQEVYATKPALAYKLSHETLENGDEMMRDVPKPSLRRCLRAVWQADDQKMLADDEGLDAIIYLRCLRMMRNIFAMLTILVFFVAAPINIVFNFKAKFIDNLTKRDALLLLTPTLLSEKQLIPHVVLGWVTNCVVLVILWYNYRCVLALRKGLMCDVNYRRDITSRTVMLTDIPRSLRSNEGVARILVNSNPRASPEAITVGHKDTAKLHELFESYHAKVLQLEYEHASHPGNTKCHTLEQKINALARTIELQRSAISCNNSLSLGSSSQFSNYGFASYHSLRDVYCTVQRGRNHGMHSGACLRLAPPCDQILWQNLRLSLAERSTKQLMVNLLYGILIILWIVPSAFIGCFLANLNRLGAVWPAFGEAMHQHPVGFAILQGVLAPLITTLVFSVLPMIFRRFSHLQGKVTRLDREHEVLRKLYAFFFLDNFFIFTIMGVIWDVVAQVLQQTQAAKSANKSLTFEEVWVSLRVAQRIATAIVNLSSFWVLYLLRSIAALFAVSAQPITLLQKLGESLNFLRKPTPRERAMDAMPQPFQYAVSFLSILFNATIALGFTSIQPLVLPIAMVLFGLAVPLKKYELLHMHITKYESNGMYWPLVVDTTLFSLAIGNLILLCVVWVQAGWQIAVPVSPLPVIVIIYKIVISVKLGRHFMYPESTSGDNEFIEKTSLFCDDTDDEPLSERYEDPAFISPLERPLFTYEEALHFCVKQQNTHHFNKLLETYEEAKEAKQPLTSECEYRRRPTVGAIKRSPQDFDGADRSPVEPYPAYKATNQEHALFYQPSEAGHFDGQDQEEHLLGYNF